MLHAKLLATLTILIASMALAGCGESPWSEQEVAAIGSLSLASLAELPADPSNRVSADPMAAELGESLFFDKRFSANGEVACASCHVPDRQFQDGIALGRGVGVTARRTMPIAGAAYTPFLFWDGRKDSLWAQALGPLESAVEHGGDRTFYVHLVAEHYREPYETLFGPLPDLSHLPLHAGPLADAEASRAWEAMPEADRDAINRIFANLGKAIAAFERGIVPAETRFDRYAASLAAGREAGAESTLTEDEIAGLRLFIGEANCINCHNGPLLTDGHFHNTGIPEAAGLPQDLGRATGAAAVREDIFNCLGPYSDAAAEDCAELRFMSADGEELVRAFKTPSLRGAASRAPFMHAGQIATLADVLDHYSAAPEAPLGHSELRPLSLSDTEGEQLVAFLKTLDNDPPEVLADAGPSFGQ